MDDPYFVYGREGCAFCKDAVALLESKRLKYYYTDVQKDSLALEWMVGLGYKTVPVIYKGQRHVGGFTELAEELRGEDNN